MKITVRDVTIEVEGFDAVEDLEISQDGTYVRIAVKKEIIGVANQIPFTPVPQYPQYPWTASPTYTHPSPTTTHIPTVWCGDLLPDVQTINFGSGCRFEGNDLSNYRVM